MKIGVDNHVHILSNEPIEFGDYWMYIHEFEDLPQDYTITKNNLPDTWFEKLWDIINYKKVIASTDESLEIPYPTFEQINK